MKHPFVHLQVHSAYSLHYGTRRIEELVEEAAKQGYTALALTDINNLYGVHRFIAACKERGVRPIIGSEIRDGGNRTVLLCVNREGFSNLCQLITARMRDEGFSLIENLIRYQGGLIALTDSKEIIHVCAGRVKTLHALLTPFSRAAAYLAAKDGIPLAAAGDVTFLDKDDESLHRVLRAIDRNTTLSRLEESDCAPKGAILFPPERALEIFTDFPQALENTMKIAEVCRFDTIFEGFVFPSCRSHMLRYPGQSSFERLRELVIEGAEIRYGEVSDAVLDRIEYELGIIQSKNFTDYFLVVADIVKKTSRTCGRGSGAASIVAYCLTITNVDPLAYHLYFERFLNPERMDPPDIDIDFAWDERDAIIDSVMADYGRDFAARVCTHNHFQYRGALREVARVYGIPSGETSAFEKYLKPGDIEKDEVWKDVCEFASRMIGLPNHLGVHSGGVVLTPKPISSYVPIETSAMGVPVATWEKDGIEDAGLVKIDLLGNRSLAVIRDAITNVKENNIPFDPNDWHPQDDEATKALLARGDSMGVFYIESPAMRQLQRKTGRGDFEHIVIHSSIIRPAANRYINEYVERLNGKPWVPLHPNLERILDETYGIMVYQEDVSKAAKALAGFSDAKADGLRKIMSKKDKGTRLDEYRKDFFDGSMRNGVGKDTVESIWNMILSFDGYSFCKPHSASYAMVSFQSAWLKAHLPAEFMAAVISNQGGYYTEGAYISEAKRMGLTILHPDVNESDYRYTGRGKYIRVGLMAIGGLRKETAERIIEERRRRGRFSGIEDFCRRVRLLDEDAEALISVGAFDGISAELNRPEQLMQVLLLVQQQKGSADQNQLFDACCSGISRRKELSVYEKRKKEYQRLGFLCDTHPFYFWDEQVKKKNRILAKDIGSHIGKTIQVIGWLVTLKEVITIQGNPMEFVSFEDESAIFETVFFPESYKRFSPLLDERVPFIIKGLVDDDHGAISIHVDNIEKLKH